ncbi:MAG TPA: SRPBCC domain-containing protein [Gemmatimonadaceae bacterium]|nr:SRPBCC domain-containing protein [Gemmatimonadaceae bacterium]
MASSSRRGRSGAGERFERLQSRESVAGDIAHRLRLSRRCNAEGGEGGSVTTVTFEEQGGKTLVVLRERHPSKEALDAAGTGAVQALVETFDQLDELLVALGESSGQ